MRSDTRQWKKVLSGLRVMVGQDERWGTLLRVIRSGKQALDAARLEMGRRVAESLMLIEREALAGPDDYPIPSDLQKWAHEEGSIFIGDQKGRGKHPRRRHVRHGEVALRSYERLRAPGPCSEDRLEKLLRGGSAQSYTETVRNAAEAFGVSPSSVSRTLGALTAKKVQDFKERALADFTPFAIFLDTLHRGGEACLVALGVDMQGEQRAMGCWQGSSENHEIGEARRTDLARRGLARSTRILFVPDGGSGRIKARRARFGKTLAPQRCAIQKSRTRQRHVAKRYRKEAHRRLTTALEQTSSADARPMRLELEAWLRATNESAADSLLDAFDELLTLHRLQVPALLRKTLMSTNPIESLFSLVRHRERHITRTRGRRMLQRWLGTVLRHCETRFKRVHGVAGIAQVIATIEYEQAEQPSAPMKKAA